MNRLEGWRLSVQCLALFRKRWNRASQRSRFVAQITSCERNAREERGGEGGRRGEEGCELDIGGNELLTGTEGRGVGD